MVSFDPCEFFVLSKKFIFCFSQEHRQPSIRCVKRLVSYLTCYNDQTLQSHKKFLNRLDATCGVNSGFFRWALLSFAKFLLQFDRVQYYLALMAFSLRWGWRRINFFALFFNPSTPEGHPSSFPVIRGAKWWFEIYFRLKSKHIWAKEFDELSTRNNNKNQ